MRIHHTQSVVIATQALAIMGIQPADGRWDVVVATLWQRLADLTRLASARYSRTVTMVLWSRSTLGRAAIIGLVYGYACHLGAGALATSRRGGCCRSVGAAR